MAKTTIAFLFILAIIATLLFGINLGKKIEKSQGQIVLPSPTRAISPTPAIPIPTSASSSAIINGQYTSEACGYEVSLPKSWIKYEYDKRSVAFASSSATDSAKIAIICSQQIPAPSVSKEDVLDYKLSTVSARLYHDTSPTDGSPLDEIIAKIPGKNMDIFIAGYGPSLTTLLNSFQFIP